MGATGREVDVRSGESFGASVPTCPGPLSRVFIWILARYQKRECPEGSTRGDLVAMSHVKPCYMLPCPNKPCGEESSICRGPTFTAILLTVRGNFKRERERQRKKLLTWRTLPWKPLRDQSAKSLIVQIRKLRFKLTEIGSPAIFSSGSSVSSLNQQSHSCPSGRGLCGRGEVKEVHLSNPTH